MFFKVLQNPKSIQDSIFQENSFECSTDRCCLSCGHQREEIPSRVAAMHEVEQDWLYPEGCGNHHGKWALQIVFPHIASLTDVIEVRNRMNP